MRLAHYYPRPVHLALVITALATTGLLGQNVIEQSIDRNDAKSLRVMQLLFGKLWKFDEYCGYYRSNEEILHDDINTEALHNGSSLQDVRTTDQLNELIEVGIKAKQALPMICSVNSWGYADESSERMSNEPDDEMLDCNLDLLDKSEPYWQFNVMNTFGRPPAGHLFRQHIWLGNYDECLQSGSFQGGPLTRYCFGSYSRNGAEPMSPNVNGFRVGLCLPSACTSRSVLDSNRQLMDRLDLLIKSTPQLPTTTTTANSVVMDGGLNKTMTMSGLFRDYHLTDIYCPPSENSLNRRLPSDNLSVLIYILAGVWLSMLVYGTLTGFSSSHSSLDNENNNNNKSLTATTTTIIRKVFDLRLNWTEFILPNGKLKQGRRNKVEEQQQQQQKQQQHGGEDKSSQQVVVKKSNYQSDELAGLNGVKVIAMNWLMLSHVYGIMITYSINTFYDENNNNVHQNARQTHWDSHQILRAFIYQGQHVVPLFFIISGMLVARKYLRNVNTTTTGQTSATVTTTGMELAKVGQGGSGEGQLQIKEDINVFKMILLRYIRLMPMYLVVYSFIKQFGHLLGSGPLWDYAVSVQSESRQCRQESWLVPILMISNFIAPFAHCVITGWHISNDFQIYLLLPIPLLIYRRSLAARSVTLGRMVCLMGFMITHLSHVYHWHRATNIDLELAGREPFVFGSRLLMDRLALDYVNPIGRFGTYFLGLFLGELLFSASSAPANYATAHRNPTAAAALSTRTTKGKRQVYDQLMSELRSKTYLHQDQQETSNVNQTQKNGRQVRINQDNHCGRPHDSDRAHFKATCWFLSGAALFIILMASLMAPNEIKRLFKPISVAYPAMRMQIELVWACLLYGLLMRRNKTHEGDGTSWMAKPWGSSWLRLPVWDRLIKLNYTLMLIHFTVARYVVQTQRQLFVFNYTNYCQLALYIIVLCYCVSLIVHLTIEVPLNKLIGLYVIKYINGRRG